MEKITMRVEALENGTVIDHIPAGQGLKILRHFQLDQSGNRVTVGFNLPSKHMGKKDLIKIENKRFNDEEAALLTLFAPHVSVNVIEDFKITKKIQPKLPEDVNGIFPCPNPNCASHREPVESRLTVFTVGEEARLRCDYCEKSYPIDWVVKNS